MVGAPLCPLPAEGGLAALEAKGSRVSTAQTAEMPEVGLQLWGFELDAGERLGGERGSGGHAEVLGCFPGCALLYSP